MRNAVKHLQLLLLLLPFILRPLFLPPLRNPLRPRYDRLAAMAFRRCRMLLASGFGRKGACMYGLGMGRASGVSGT